MFFIEDIYVTGILPWRHCPSVTHADASEAFVFKTGPNPAFSIDLESAAAVHLGDEVLDLEKELGHLWRLAKTLLEAKMRRRAELERLMGDEEERLANWHSHVL